MAIPAPKPSDSEDVAWALSTAETLWRRGERADAISWVKRAARAAGEVEDDLRQLELARAAAELSDLAAPPPPVASIEVDVDLPSGPLSVELNSSSPLPQDLSFESPKAPKPAPPRPPPPRKAQPSIPAPPLGVGLGSVSPGPPVVVGQGQLAVSGPPGPPPPPRRPSPSVVPAADLLPPVGAQANLTTSSKPAMRFQKAPVVTLDDEDEGPLLSATPAPQKLSLRSSSQTVQGGFGGGDVTTTVKGAPPRETLDQLRRFSQQRAEQKKAEPVAPPPPPSVPPESVGPTPSEHQRPTAPPPPPVALEQPNLDDVIELADLPDDVRASLAGKAQVMLLSDSPVDFGLVLVLEGDVDVVPVGANSPAARITKGVVLRDRCPVPSDLALRLVGASPDARVAVWTTEIIDEHLADCPWVEDELRSGSSLVHALAGIERGALGKKMDPTLRYELTKTLSVRMVPEGEIVAVAGEPVPGIIVVGVGELELVNEERITGTLTAGQFLFPLEVLGGAKAQRTARGGRGGALVLAGDRKRTQEIVVTYPALLEILAGM